MATSAPAPNSAVNTNVKIFARYHWKLAHDGQTGYEEVITKLLAWLDNEKAYYPDARPEVRACITSGS